VPLGALPTGFKRKDKTAVPDPGKTPLIRRIFELAASGTSLEGTAIILQKEGWRTPRGKAEFSTLAINNIIKNPRYKGRWPGNQWRALHEYGKKTKYVLRPEEEWIWHDGPWFIEKSLWERANSERTRRKDESPRRQGDHEAFLLRAGYIFCSRCGNKLHGIALKNGTRQYKCDRRRNRATGEKGCRGVALVAHKVDGPVWGKCLELADHPLVLIHVGILQMEDGTLDAKIAERREELEELDAEVDRLTDRLVIAHPSAVPKINATLESLTPRRAALAAELSQLKKQTSAVTELKSLRDALEEMRQEGMERLEEYTYAEKRTLIHRLGGRVTVHPGNRVPQFELEMTADPWDLSMGELASTPAGVELAQRLASEMTRHVGLTLPPGYDLDDRGFLIDPDGKVVRDWPEGVAGAAPDAYSADGECALLSATPRA
jgi:hypothetical protein